MPVFERAGNLFSSPDPALAQCISADAHMGRGIAVAVKNRFPTVRDIKPYQAKVGQVVVCQDSKAILNLVTKPFFHSKPTLASIHWCLIQMRELALELGILQVSIPRISCGLDKQNWLEVRDILSKVFDHSPIQVTVYHMEA